MRTTLALGAMGVLLAACAQPVPDSGIASGAALDPGVGFGDYAAYELERARREAALTGASPGTFASPVPVAAAPIAAPMPAPVPPGGIPAADLAAAGIGVAPVATAPLGTPLGAPPATPAAPPPGATVVAAPAVPGVTPVPGGPLPPLGTGITPAAPSAVPGTLAAATPAAPATPLAPPPAGLAASPAATPEWNPDADPLRDSGLEAQPGNAAPELAGVTAPPPAPATTGPNIVEYALNAPNARGQEWYSRFAFSGEGRADRNCASYASPDEAQRDFLARGGPERDARGIDPDGDGFACTWDPAPFLAAVGR